MIAHDDRTIPEDIQPGVDEPCIKQSDVIALPLARDTNTKVEIAEFNTSKVLGAKSDETAVE